ncbi:response regulator transcription factor [Streptomyces goshikiensis]|uniref:response regulator transcription factor n=1 Tax=Streptomyces goshikiensis TaxID=1942 RepID=UPI00368009CF
MPTATAASSSHVAIIDPEPDVRERLARAGAAVGFTVAFPDDPEAWAVGHDGVVLLTIRAPSELATVEQLFDVNPRLVVVALLSGTATDLGPSALRHGATVVMDRSSDPHDVLIAAHLARRGTALLPARVLDELVRPVSVGPDELRFALDESERTLLQDLADGATVQRMARHRHQATRTVERHLRRLYLRIGADSRTQAVAKASRMGLVRVS